MARIFVSIGRDAPELERFAAEELCRYLLECFGAEARIGADVPDNADILFLVGSPATNPAVESATGQRSFPQLSDQGFVLRRMRSKGRRSFLLGGGSPRATMWAVYELAQRWGVRYLLHGDSLPRRRSPWLPNIDETMEPEFTIRQWRVVNDFACGPESWGMGDYRPLIDQIAKLKFNRLYVFIYAYQPFLKFEAGGVTRSSGTLWFGFSYPITDDMIGRELFDDRREFWNPDLPLNVDSEELAAAGERLLKNIMQYAESRGMECVLSVYLTEFPPEFASVLGDVEEGRPSFGKVTIVPGDSIGVDDPALTELAGAIIRSAIDTYPEARKLVVDMPEQRRWVPDHERAWAALDDRYWISRVASLESVLAAAQNRSIYPGGVERAVNEVKGDIVNLYFYDRLIHDTDAVKGSTRPDINFIWDSVAEELFPILEAIVDDGSETQNFVDYTPSNILRRREALADLVAVDLPATLIYTLHDDNVGVLPQLTATSLHELTVELKRHGWAGFTTRYWLIGDHDPTVAYLSRAAWEQGTTAADVASDQVSRVFGRACVRDMLEVFREVEAATVILEQHAMGVAFPVPGMMMKQWTDEPFPEELASVRDCYGRALDSAARAGRKTSAQGSHYVKHWIGRLEFGIQYLEAVELVRNAAKAEAAGQIDEAIRQAEEGLAAARRSIEAQVRVARDQSDRGAVAVLNEHVYRPLRDKIADLRSEV